MEQHSHNHVEAHHCTTTLPLPGGLESQADLIMSGPPTNSQSAPHPAPSNVSRIMLDNAQNFLGLLEPDGTVIDVNQRVREIHGSNYEQVLGQPIWESPVWLSEARTRLQQAVSRASRGERVQLELNIVSDNGQRMTIDFSLRPVWDDTGKVTYLISEGHDVTERKQLEGALELERAFLQAVLDNIADGIAACDAKGMLTVFNPASRTFHNLREFPIPAADWAEHYDLYQPNGLTPLKAEEVPLYRALQGEVVQDVEMVIAPKGGKKRRLLASGRALAGRGGEPLGAVVAMHDITVTHKAEVALRKSEEHCRAVLSSLHEGVVEQDQRGRIMMANTAAERLLGLTEAQLLERDSLDPRWRTVHEDGTPFPGETHPAMAALRTGKPQEDIVMGVHKPNGSLTWILVNCRPLWRLGEVEPYAVVSSMVDITQMKQTEAQLRYTALHDALTDLPTATLFRTRLEQALAHASHDPDYRFAVLYIDLDGFKTVNDTLGHSIGDNLLITVARQLENCVRESDTVARLGGDEFVILFKHLTHPNDAIQLAERVLHDLMISLNVAEREVNVSASIGIVIVDEPQEVQELLKAADQAMYRAKVGGKAQYWVFKKAAQ
jgi:diguanylate cyclase (GGDEF)-like protein/PAS domain S-box-containing protein